MPFFDDDVQELSESALNKLKEHNYKLALAESCTGGLVSGCLVSVPSASEVVDRGFITYSNESKAQVLMVNPDTLLKYGSVSPEVASSMAYNARRLSRCDVGLSVTGVAGPGGGTTEKPVGLVYFALSIEGQDMITNKEMFGDIGRMEIRKQSVITAIKMMCDNI